MHVKYQLNRDNSFVKTVNTQKKIELNKFPTCNSNFEKSLLQKCITQPPIFGPNLKKIGLIDIDI